MYRIVNFGGNPIAVELLTSGRTMEDEWEDIETFVNEGNTVTIVEDYEEEGAELIVRDYV